MPAQVHVFTCLILRIPNYPNLGIPISEVLLAITYASRHLHSPYLPLLLPLPYPTCHFLLSQVDTIEPCPRITVREAGHILRGPKSHGPPSPLSPRSNMHPVSSTCQNLEHLDPAVTGRRHVHRVTEVAS